MVQKEKVYCLDDSMGMGHMCIYFNGGICEALESKFCDRKGTAFEYKYMVLNDFTEVKQKIREEFEPFFEAMITSMVKNYLRKGDSWKSLDWAYLMHKLSVQFEDMINRDDEDFYANIGNYAAMLWTNTKNGLYQTSAPSKEAKAT